MNRVNSEWRQVLFINKKRIFKGHTRHWSQVCVVCWKRKRNIGLHFKMYHPKYIKQTEELVIKALSKGEVGIINGFRIIRTV